MEYKAIIFDLFETLITEWGHEKYTKRKMCSDLGICREEFDIYWNEKEEDRYVGNISFQDSLLYICEKCGKVVDQSTILDIAEKRMKAKSLCFEYVDSDVYQLLSNIKAMGLKTAIISNCSSEEVKVIKESKIYQYIDYVLLSYEVKLRKPDIRIYKEAIDMLGVNASECIYVGDGGDNELEGAKMLGLKAIQAKWYTNHHPTKRESKVGFLTAEAPLDILQYMIK